MIICKICNKNLLGNGYCEQHSTSGSSYKINNNIMKHENLNWQLSNLELSKKLCELGVPQDSLFYWYVGLGERIVTKEQMEAPIQTSEFKQYYSAFTCSELGEMLPQELDDGKYTLHITTFGSYWYVSYLDIDKKVYYFERMVTEADARAKMLIYLIENKLITL